MTIAQADVGERRSDLGTEARIFLSDYVRSRSCDYPCTPETRMIGASFHRRVREAMPSTGRPTGDSGFTLIEMVVVVVVIGILVTIAVPNVRTATERARRASCVSNQRHLISQSLLYAADNHVSEATIGSGDLFDNGYCPERLSECPSSTFLDHDDYQITIVDYQVTEIECLVEPDAHAWSQ